ncbi:Scramblase family protein [Coccidioides posadasii C735 delta SOWgp]|uniref:Scramblase family protein n=1 Tax=Coccidioides posadasii (strain C735) TaxID=222929 RepID=C5P4X4_COCP7|nr:Scramblase family protein [Coccidioides posadasii C735 delta SOWgp]EER27764.1 Scramblase family protein [Coccidioides posadasii C735 delta SOWgp]|eukprot:XP_003069909.1 Scramblase family protein [Coccidioides posadasii C735 delta SOWgp]
MWPRRITLSTPRLSLVRTARSSRDPRISRRPIRKSFPRPNQRARARPSNSQPRDDTQQQPGQPSELGRSALEALSSTLHDTNPQNNSLLAPVHIPEDPSAVLKDGHPATRILANSGLVVQRQLEMMNVLLGFEQANRYTILDAHGNHVGYMAEQDTGMGTIMGRQFLHTHRPFVTHIFDIHQNEVLRAFYDPLEAADATRSTAAVHLAAGPTGGVARLSTLDHSQMRVIGEAQQEWALLRRKYNLFLFHEPPVKETKLSTQAISFSSSDLSKSQQSQVSLASGGPSQAQRTQFAYVNEPVLSWDFSLRTANEQLIGSVNRNFAGFAREIFTDTGVYALRMDSAGLEEQRLREATARAQAHPSIAPPEWETPPPMTLDQRAVMLATAVSIDFDYFSRHSGSPGILPYGMFGLGGAGAESVAGGAAAGMAGAGTLAGYEAMRSGASAEQDPSQVPQQHEGEDASPGETTCDEQGPGYWEEPVDEETFQDHHQDEWPGESGEGDDSWSDFF